MFQRVVSAARAQAVRVPVVPSRQLHATPITSETVKEKVSQMADTVNKKLGKGLASAIETGEEATEKSKEALGATKRKAKETSDTAKEKASEGAAQAAQKKNELKSEIDQQAKS